MMSENMTTCPDCEKDISKFAKSCPHCGRPFEAQADTKPWHKKSLHPLIIIAVLCGVVFILSGFFRFYYGGNMTDGPKLVLKEGFSFKDTIVNINDIIGMPKIIAKAQHPQAVKQLQEMGILESDSAAESRIKNDINKKMHDAMKNYPK
jgi:hypothetical protein